MEWKSSRFILINKTPLFYLVSIFFFSVCALLSTRTACLDINCSLTGKADKYFQEFENKRENGKHEDAIVSDIGRTEFSLSMARRFLSGPGSSPPRCTSKCGRCTPCKPVHVPVPPGTPVTAEYYPEAWRCKCGNKLYMP
ncbi:hypothetical protein L1049_013228 [Liquidambar formosana]|uniref:Epidermal patterning factor-like protein n=1 Tax=Liquidambar formosana TaxID=63359 RepID=A0AAP0WTX4_LIQFO